METDLRLLEIDMLSANDLPNMNILSKMDVYIVSSISSDRRSTERTPVDKKGGTNPKWKNFKMRFYIDEFAVKQNQVILMFQIISRRVLGDRTIGYVHVPLKPLLDEETLHEIEGQDGKKMKKIQASFQVSTLSGKAKGTLCFMYHFGEKFKVLNQHQGYNYSTNSGQGIQEFGCFNNHFPMAYGYSNVGPVHCQGYPSEYYGQNKRISCFGLGFIFEWGSKFYEDCSMWKLISLQCILSSS
ncbi:hypothetical protein V2J09_003031 [Rumex salicifolius]